jgi:hypothetical protein
MWSSKMTSQEQAFRAYYASMTDAELLKIAANKNSFIEVAQKVLADELKKRNLAVPPEPSRTIVSRQSTPVRLFQRTFASTKSALLKWRMRLASKK